MLQENTLQAVQIGKLYIATYITGHIMATQSTKLTCFITKNIFFNPCNGLTYFKLQNNAIGKYSTSTTNW
jgi:hypothetical protein